MYRKPDWKKVLKADPTDWLLESDDAGVRYLALRDIVDAGEKEIKAAKVKAHCEGPIGESPLRGADCTHNGQNEPGRLLGNTGPGLLSQIQEYSVVHYVACATGRFY